LKRLKTIYLLAVGLLEPVEGSLLERKEFLEEIGPVIRHSRDMDLLPRFWDKCAPPERKWEFVEGAPLRRWGRS